MNDCQIQPLISAYHDRELDAAGTADVERHLGQCSSCAAALAQMQEMSAQIAATTGDQANTINRGETLRLHQAIDFAASEERDGMRIFRTAGLLAAMAASVLIVSGVWLMDLRSAAPMAGAAPTQSVAMLPEWQRIAVTLHADPRPEIVEDSFYAPHYASTVNLMLDGLMLSGR